MTPERQTETDDDLLMTLVEAAMDRPADQREVYLRSVCANDSLYEQVRSRVDWEVRMGGFLLEPLVKGDNLNRPFEPGMRIADRFRIVREAGSGGMGVVYEAIDEKLDRRVALKCARLGYRHRLPPEARSASEVSHFNVCKVHELHVAETPAGLMEFLSMEFIEGETLEAHIGSRGSLPEEEVREIVRQVCGGLAQAHRQGVIHGDLKCANVLLAQSPEGGLRAVITDFGLARVAPGERLRGMMSVRGGTLDYMAPELFHGSRASVQSDVYAVGVLMHVMLTGKTPRQLAKERSAPVTLDPASDSKASTQTIAQEPAVEGMKQLIGEMPRRWLPIVTRCLEAVPEKRFGSADEVAAALAARPVRVWAWVVAAGMLIAALVAGWWQFRAPPDGPPVRLAILPFALEGQSLTSEAEIGQDIANRLAGARRGFVTIPPIELQRGQVNDAEKARSILGATHVLETRLRADAGRIVVTSSLIAVGSGQVLRDLHGSHAAGETQAIAKGLLAMVTSAFHLRGMALEEVSPPAYPYYVQGQALLARDTDSANEAMANFAKAIALDPRSALPYAGMAEAQALKFRRGFGRQWLDQAEASIAKARSINGDAVPVLLAAGRVQQDHGAYEQAAREFSRAAELEPNNSDVWRRLAVVYEQSNRTEEAVATYQKAIAAQPNYYRHYLDFGNFFLFRGLYRDAEANYRKVIELAPKLTSGHMNLGLALLEQGRFAEAEAAMLQALALRTSATLFLNTGAVYYQEEKFKEALSCFQQALEAAPPTGVRYKDLADALRHLGRAQAAAAAYRKARAMVQSEITQNPRQAGARALLALILALLGESAQADYEMAQALAIEPENAMVMRDAAIAYEVLGRHDRALGVLSRAPVYLLEELSRDPDAVGLRQDERFQKLLHTP